MLFEGKLLFLEDLILIHLSQKEKAHEDHNKSLIFAVAGASNINDTFCSVCSVYILIDQIYELSNYECINSSRVKIPSADVFVKNIEKISSTFTVGAQQDPAKFLLFLFNHLIQCLSSKECFVNGKSNNSIQHLFGINIRRRSQCQICFNEYFSTTWESILAISIDDHTHVTTAIKEFFKEELLTNETLYECSHYTRRKSLELANWILRRCHRSFLLIFENSLSTRVCKWAPKFIDLFRFRKFSI